MLPNPGDASRAGCADMANTQIIALLVGGSIGLVLAVPLTWGAFRFIDYRDRTRIERWERKTQRRIRKLNRR